MPGPEEIQKEKEQNIRSNLFNAERELSKPDLNAYKQQNEEYFSEQMMEKMLGKKIIRQTEREENVYHVNELSFASKISKYREGKNADKDSKDYVNAITQSHITNNHYAWKRRRYAGQAEKYYKECQSKADKLSAFRQEKITGKEEVSSKDLEKEYEQEMSILDSRLLAMTAAAKAKSRGEDDEKIRILRAKLAILSCKRKLTSDMVRKLSGEEGERYQEKIEKWRNEMDATRTELFDLTTALYGQDAVFCDRNKAKKLKNYKERTDDRKAELRESIAPDEGLYIYCRLANEGKIKTNLPEADIEKMNKDIESYAIEKHTYKPAEYYRNLLINHVVEKNGDNDVQEMRAKKAETEARIKGLSIGQTANLLYHMYNTGSVPNTIVPVVNALLMNEELGKDSDFMEYVAKPLLEGVWDPKVIDMVDNINTLQPAEIPKNPQLLSHNYVSKQGFKREVKQNAAPVDKTQALMIAQEAAMEKYMQGFGFTDDRAFMDKGFEWDDNQPFQGCKIHVGVSNKTEYLKALHLLVPEFMRLGISFKVLRLGEIYENTPEENEMYKKLQYGRSEMKLLGGNRGKEFTIYPNQNFDLDRMSPEVRAFLTEKSDYNPKSDLTFGNRMSVRYGAYKSPKILQTNGDAVKDIRDERENPIEKREEDKTIDEIVSFHKDLKRDYQEGKISAEQLIQDYCMGQKTAPGDNLFQLYIFDNADNADSLYRKIPQEHRRKYAGVARLHMFGKYIVVVPKKMYKTDVQTRANVNGVMSEELKQLVKEPNVLDGNPW